MLQQTRKTKKSILTSTIECLKATEYEILCSKNFYDFTYLGEANIQYLAKPLYENVQLGYFENMLYVKNVESDPHSFILKLENLLLNIITQPDDIHQAQMTHSCTENYEIMIYPKNISSSSSLIRFLSYYCIRHDFYFNYKILDGLGHGGYSEVFLTKNINSGDLFAVKKISCKGKTSKPLFIKQIIQELTAMRFNRHKCIPAIYEVHEMDVSIMVVMEYIKGQTLRQLMKKVGLKKEVNFCIIWSLISTLYTLNCNGYIHRDIKPLNIIVKDVDLEENWDIGLEDIVDKHCIYLIDYGQAIKEHTLSYNQLKSRVCGTAGYMPPEMLNTKSDKDRKELDHFKYDSFSIGIIIYELMTGMNPFIRSTAKETIHENTKCNIPMNNKELKYLDEEELELIKLLTIKDPVKRLTVNEAQAHPSQSKYEYLLYESAPPISKFFEENRQRMRFSNMRTNLQELNGKFQSKNKVIAQQGSNKNINFKTIQTLPHPRILTELAEQQQNQSSSGSNNPIVNKFNTSNRNLANWGSNSDNLDFVGFDANSLYAKSPANLSNINNNQQIDFSNQSISRLSVSNINSQMGSAINSGINCFDLNRSVTNPTNINITTNIPNSKSQDLGFNLIDKDKERENNRIHDKDRRSSTGIVSKRQETIKKQNGHYRKNISESEELDIDDSDMGSEKDGHRATEMRRKSSFGGALALSIDSNLTPKYHQNHEIDNNDDNIVKLREQINFTNNKPIVRGQTLKVGVTRKSMSPRNNPQLIPNIMEYVGLESSSKHCSNSSLQKETLKEALKSSQLNQDDKNDENNPENEQMDIKLIDSELSNNKISELSNNKQSENLNSLIDDKANEAHNKSCNDNQNNPIFNFELINKGSSNIDVMIKDVLMQESKKSIVSHKNKSQNSNENPNMISHPSGGKDSIEIVNYNIDVVPEENCSLDSKHKYRVFTSKNNNENQIANKFSKRSKYNPES